MKFCSLSAQFLPPCPLANPSYVMRVYGAAILTIAIMQNESLRALLGHVRLRSLGRLSFPIYLTIGQSSSDLGARPLWLWRR